MFVMQPTVGLYHKLALLPKFIDYRLLQYRLSTHETAIVQIKGGQIRGAKRRTVYDDEYWAFEGIPYAQPPVAELRFRAPRPVQPWQGVKDCTRCQSAPLQMHAVFPLTTGSEDCLYLNVYVNKLERSQTLPVMVWFFGGGFRYGEATRDTHSPDYFMRQGLKVVLVTVNYRLGPLGFLSLADPDLQVPGNAGLKDQLLALRWVNSNINYFGGDERNITICGLGAGGASAHFLLLSQRAEGLCHKAILQSASALCPWAQQTPADAAYRLAQELGYSGSNNNKQVFRFLAQQEGAKLISAANGRRKNMHEKQDLETFPFVPVVEPYESEDCVLSKDPLELMSSAWSNRIPVIMGTCSFEGLLYYQLGNKLSKDWDDWAILIPKEIRANLNEMECTERGQRLRKAHLGSQKLGAENLCSGFLELMSYKHFLHGIHRTFLSRLNVATAATYLYRFDFDSPHSNVFRTLVCDRTMRGTCHADDLFFMFSSVACGKLEPGTPEFKTMERLTAMWTAFAAHSDPNCEEIRPSVWLPGRRDDVPANCFNIKNQSVELIAMPEWQKLSVWNSLYEKQKLY